ncbi:MAG: SurA N-terminal domain-containing protein [Rikenellaceae bacterium]|nr:SurA N-terminal domain-containing protein [Rikenellaceae bacterium]
MAGLNTLRTRGGLFLAIVVGIALVAFLLTDFLSNGQGNNPAKLKVGEINGEKVTYLRYSNQLNYTTNIQKMLNGNASGQDSYDAYRKLAWEELIEEMSFTPGFSTNGITVSKQEATDMVNGEYISPILARFFTDQSGQYSKEAVMNFLNAINAENADPNYVALWDFIEDQMIDNRRLSKYMNLIQKGIFVTDLEINNGVENSDVNYNAQFAGLPYAAVADSLIKVNVSDLQKFYNEHKDMFKTDASRSIEYVVFDVMPSEDDFVEAKNTVLDIAENFKNATDIEAFVSANSQEQFDYSYYKESDLQNDLANFVFGSSKDAVYGPILNGDVYMMARVSDRRMMPDSIELSRIVLNSNMVNEADSISALAEKGANFAELANKHSVVEGTQGGKLGMIAYNQLPREMAERLFSAKKGEIVKFVDGNALQLIRIDDRMKEQPMVQLGIIIHRIIASEATRSSIRQIADKFYTSANGSLTAFNQSVSDNALSKRVAVIRPADSKVNGLEESGELVRWAYKDETKKDIVSNVMEINGNFVVAVLTNANDEGYADFESVKSEIAPIVRLELKGKYLAEQFAGKKIEDVAAMTGATSGDVADVNFNAFFLDKIGPDQAVIGAISGAKENTVSKPVVGSSGVYLLNVTAKNKLNEATPESEKVKLQANAENFVVERTLQALYDLSNIQDWRVKYF